jgi:hypothetical protein
MQCHVFGKSRENTAAPSWQTASPKWRFDDATFDRTAKAFDNPDHVDMVIHNYRWRLGLAESESKYDDLERQLATGPAIAVPTITLEGDANGAPHLDPARCLRQTVLGQVRPPAFDGWHRAQPAAGSPTLVCRRSRRRR